MFVIGGDNYLMDLTKIKDDILFHNEDTRFQINNYAEKITLLKDLKSLELSNSNLIYGKSIHLEVNDLVASFEESKIATALISFHCDDNLPTPVQNCLKNSNIKTGSLILDNGLQQILNSELSQIEDIKLNSKVAPQIQGIDAKIEDSNLIASVIIKFLFNVQVNVYSTVDFDQENLKIHLTNFTVKKGVVPVTSIVLRTLKKMNLNAVEINGNNLTISL